MQVVFNKPFKIDKEFEYIQDAIDRGELKGDGYYTKKCHEFLEKFFSCKKALLTHSCTAALEMAAILLDLNKGDEVIIPSYTFVSTANAFVLRGAIPVFVDIRPDTLNIDETLIEKAITKKTKAICVVHYAGVACEMDKILEIAQKHNLAIVEDAAQAIGCSYKGKSLGTIGDMGCFSFHETKNVISGEGGALIINNEKYITRAEIIREKGTNRTQFFRGEIDKYTWVDIGSSFLPSDMIAAYLYSQLENITKINQKRMYIWNAYNEFFKQFEDKGFLKRPYIPQNYKHNAHMYYLLFNDLKTRTEFIKYLKQNEIYPVFHYIPLHSSPAGEKYCKTASKMAITDKTSDTLVRMPMFYEIRTEDLNRIFDVATTFFNDLILSNKKSCRCNCNIIK